MFKIDKSFKTGDIVGINPKDMNHTFILCDYEFGIISGYINILKIRDKESKFEYNLDKNSPRIEIDPSCFKSRVEALKQEENRNRMLDAMIKKEDLSSRVESMSMENLSKQNEQSKRMSLNNGIFKSNDNYNV